MAKRSKDAYSKLHEISKQTSIFSSIFQLLGWDQETYLPRGAIESRSAQIETLASLIHKQSTSGRFSKALNKLIDIKTGTIQDDRLSAEQIAALKLWRKDYLRSVKLPASFVKVFAETTSKAVHVWADAKKQNDFALFSPFLQKIISLSRKKADYLGFEEHPYDALLDLFEPGTKTSSLVPLFSRLKIALMELVKTLSAKPPVHSPFHGEFPDAKQMEFGRFILKKMGFDPLTSRLDLSAHPFCMGIHLQDVRMTTRIHTDNPMSNIFAVIHEGGHGLYHRNLPLQHYGTPLCEPASWGIDESQSRFWETIIGHSLPFWRYFYPKLQAEFPEKLSNTSLEDFFRAINTVKPSLIRIESDEATYSLHIILRFELEKALIEGHLKPKEIPEAWNEKMREYFGITPPQHSLGCLQDIHWSIGAIGYFPTYTLGNLYAAQFRVAFEKAFPDWEERVASGHLSFIEEWLKQHIHRYGRQYSPAELIQRLTGKPLSEEAYVHYLRHKFSVGKVL